MENLINFSLFLLFLQYKYKRFKLFIININLDMKIASNFDFNFIYCNKYNDNIFLIKNFNKSHYKKKLAIIIK